MKTKKGTRPQNPQKAPTGIERFDEITTGGPGGGKTILSLQSLVNGARLQNETGIFVAFEESYEGMVTNAAKFGWDLPALQKQEKLFFLDAQPNPDLIHAGGFDLNGMLAIIKSRAARDSNQSASIQRQTVLDSEEAELEGRLKAIQRELAAKRTWKRTLNHNASVVTGLQAAGRTHLRALRGMDKV